MEFWAQLMKSGILLHEFPVLYICYYISILFLVLYFRKELKSRILCTLHLSDKNLKEFRTVAMCVIYDSETMVHT
jgi:hypothetical protein